MKHKLAEMKTDVVVGRAFVDQCIELHSQKRLDSQMASMAKCALLRLTRVRRTALLYPPSCHHPTTTSTPTSLLFVPPSRHPHLPPIHTTPLTTGTAFLWLSA